MITRIETNSRMSRAIVHQGVVYLAGQVAADTSADITGQTETMLAKVEQLLKDAGSDKGQLLNATIYISDPENFAAMNAVWDEWTVPGQSPARTCVVASLPREELLVEITVSAAVNPAA